MLTYFYIFESAYYIKVQVIQMYGVDIVSINVVCSPDVIIFHSLFYIKSKWMMLFFYCKMKP